MDSNQGGEIFSDESLGCSVDIDEENYYHCAKDVIVKKLQNSSSPGCTVPMFANIFEKRYGPKIYVLEQKYIPIFSNFSCMFLI